MAGLIYRQDPSTEPKPVNGCLVPTSGLLFPRRIEFHHARKPFTPYFNGDFHLETLNPISEAQKSTANVPAITLTEPKLEGSHFCELSLDPDLTLKEKIRRIGAGLANLGNTCFLNSVLQCLTYTEPLAAYFQSGKHKSSCHVAGFCAMCAIENHVMIALKSSGKILSPSHLVKNLRCISRNFRNSRQEDAHEYMVNLMESMHKCCLPSGVSSESPFAYEKSLVHKIFGGRLRSQVKCKQCSHGSNTYDPFLDLSLQIVKADSLHKALANFTAVEQLDGGEKRYRCERCREKVQAFKQLTIHKAPRVLTIHLKRFGYGMGEKIDKKVVFGTSLDLKPYVSGPYEGDLKYTLYGVLVHLGWSTHSGHYFCFVRTSSGMWHALDDNKVKQVSEKLVLEQKAYMLFYVVDRGSTPKRTVGVVRERNTVAGVVKTEKLPASPSDPKETIRNGKVERRSSTISNVEASSKDLVLKEPSVLQTDGQVMREGFKESALPAENGASTATSKPLDDATLATESGKINLGNGHHAYTLNVQGSHMDSGVSSHVVLPNSCNGFLDGPCPEKFPSENGLHGQNENSGKDKRPSNPRSEGFGERELERSASAKFSNKLTVGETVLRLETSGSVERSSASNGCVQEVVDKSDGHDVLDKCDDRHLTQTKPKKLTKYPFMSRKVLFFSALRPRSRHKQGKRRRLHSRNFTRNNFLEASTAKEANVKLCNGISTIVKGRVVGERCEQSDAMLATNEQLESRSLADCCFAGEPNGRSERRSIQNCLVDLLTRGLEEVACWEGIEREPSEMGKLKDSRPKSIGYLLDEWDEEYDRGKRKKLRKADHFDASRNNPFQEFATKKAQSKQMNMDCAKSGNQPPRIHG